METGIEIAAKTETTVPTSDRKPRPNTKHFDTREAWLRAATDRLRPYFQQYDAPLPEKIRYSIGFTSGGKKGKIEGECWYPGLSDDGHFEIFIRCDFADPVEVLGILVHELTHAALPPEAKHGKQYRALAVRLGLEGKMMHAAPGPALTERLNDLAGELGPLPHAALNFHRVAADKPKKQGTRMLKAECETCSYTVRLAKKWVVDVGAPHCPKHGPMTCDMPEESEEAAETETGE